MNANIRQRPGHKLDEMARGSYQVINVTDIGETPCRCDKCGWRGAAAALGDIGSCKLTPGDPSPAGRCPECASLAYPDTPMHRSQMNSEALVMVLERLLDADKAMGSGRALDAAAYKTIQRDAATVLRRIRAPRYLKASSSAGTDEPPAV